MVKKGRPLRVLMVSSRPPEHSANLGLDRLLALRERGIGVDYLSTYRSNLDLPGLYSVYDKVRQHYGKEKPNLKWALAKMSRPREMAKFINNRFHDPKYILRSTFPKHPDVSPEAFINAVPGGYDVVMTLFWHNDITCLTLRKFHEKWNAPALIEMTDFIPVTGGCANPWDCAGIYDECADCPACTGILRGRAHKNWLLRKNTFGRMPVSLVGNTWIKRIVEKEGLLGEGDSYVNCGFAIDSGKFVMADRIQARSALGLPEDAFIMFTGASRVSEPRKGWPELVRALSAFREREGSGLRAVLAVAGNDAARCVRESPLPAVDLGFLDVNGLVNAYNAADVYLSPSIQDAGPSMVNQALMCGTPVVSFNIGAALDVVKDGETGYMVPLGDTGRFADGISRVMHAPDAGVLRENCRSLAVDAFSLQAYAENIESVLRNLVERNRLSVTGA